MPIWTASCNGRPRVLDFCSWTLRCEGCKGREHLGRAYLLDDYILENGIEEVVEFKGSSGVNCE